MRASILDFKPRLGNRCRVLPGNVLPCAVILDFRGSILESLQGGVLVIGSACSTIVVAPKKNGPPAVLSSLLQRRMVPPAAPSLLHGRTARLQNDRGGRSLPRRNDIRSPVPSFSAATTFALRFHLSPPQRHSASGSIFLRRNDIRAPVPSFSAATKTVLRPEPRKTKKGWPAWSPLLYKGIRLIC